MKILENGSGVTYYAHDINKSIYTLVGLIMMMTPLKFQDKETNEKFQDKDTN